MVVHHTSGVAASYSGSRWLSVASYSACSGAACAASTGALSCPAVIASGSPTARKLLVPPAPCSLPPPPHEMPSPCKKIALQLYMSIYLHM